MPTARVTDAELAEWERRGLIPPREPAKAPQLRSSGQEAAFLAGVIREAKRCGWRLYHTKDSRKSVAGFPDLVMVRGNRCIFAELKTEVGKASADQLNWLDDLRSVTEVKVELWRPSDWTEILEVLK